MRIERPLVLLALASFLSLFLELLLIRWVASEVWLFAYFKNLVLVSCFFGFGLGCFLSRRRAPVALSVMLLLALVVLVKLPPRFTGEFGPSAVTENLSGFRDLQVFGSRLASSPLRVGLGFLWLVIFVGTLALVLFPFGQLVASAMEGTPSRMGAYSVNVLASLAGTWAFTGACWLGTPPWIWCSVVVLFALPLVEGLRARIAALLLLSAAVYLLVPRAPNYEEFWSPYQKIARTGVKVAANNYGYMAMLPVPPRTGGRFEYLDGHTFPYFLAARPSRVLILGSGAGQDAATALAAGAERVVCVEIDPVIHRIGERHHPDRPYDDPRVEVVIDDARHYSRLTDETFDLVVLSFLDSHTLLSEFTNVRLDNYIYTVEAFRRARQRLAEDGVFFLSFDGEHEWIVERMARTISAAFGDPPVTLVTGRERDGGRFAAAAFLVAARTPAGTGRLRAKVLADPAFASFDVSVVEVDERGLVLEDDWPFLYLRDRNVPALVLLVTILIAGLSAAGVRWLAIRNAPFEWEFFLLGAGFMLIEVHNVSRLAVLQGTTWLVTSWTITAILVMILAGNALVVRLGFEDSRWAYAVLVASLAGVYLVPLGVFERLPRLLEIACSVSLVSLPVLFAALCFGARFRSTRNVRGALGSNVLGALCGGLLEGMSFVTGLRSLALVAALLYAAALLSGRRSK